MQTKQMTSSTQVIDMRDGAAPLIANFAPVVIVSLICVFLLARSWRDKAGLAAFLVFLFLTHWMFSS